MIAKYSFLIISLIQNWYGFPWILEFIFWLQQCSSNLHVTFYLCSYRESSKILFTLRAVAIMPMGLSGSPRDYLISDHEHQYNMIYSCMCFTREGSWNTSLWDILHQKNSQMQPLNYHVYIKVSSNLLTSVTY